MLAPGPTDFAGGKRSRSPTITAPDPTGVPAELASADLVAARRISGAGRRLRRLPHRHGRPAFAGGFAFKLPFGTIYSPNITPDKETGIGDWSDADFLAPCIRASAATAAHLYPALPYTSATRYMTDADALAIKAYLFSLPPVQRPRRANTLAFPFNQRWLMAFWSLLFNPRHALRADTASAARNGTAAPISPRRWPIAANATRRATSPRRWTTAANSPARVTGGLARLQHHRRPRPAASAPGAMRSSRNIWRRATPTGHGTAAGPMGEAVDKSLQPSDARRHRSHRRLSAQRARACHRPICPRRSRRPRRHRHKRRRGSRTSIRAARRYSKAPAPAAMAGAGVSPVIGSATLTGARAVNDPSGDERRPDRDLRRAADGGRGRHHAGLRQAYSDIEIAAVANYVTARFGAKPSQIVAAEVASLRGRAVAPSVRPAGIIPGGASSVIPA